MPPFRGFTTFLLEMAEKGLDFSNLRGFFVILAPNPVHGVHVELLEVVVVDGLRIHTVLGPIGALAPLQLLPTES